MTEENPPLNGRVKRVSFPRMLWEFLLAKGNIFQFAVRIYRQFGDVVWLPLGLPAYVISDPKDLRHVLVANAENYHKIGALVIAKKFMGEGLLTSDGATHHRHRRAMQPMFHRKKIQSFAETMIACARRRADMWQEGQTIDMMQEMMHITSSVISRTLFSIDLEEEAHELSQAITEAQRCIVEEIKIPIPLPFLSGIRARRYEQAVQRLDRSLLPILRARMAPDAPVKDDLLNMLLEIRFEDGGKMSEKELRDEVITLFIGGHETSANTLAWSLYLLSQNPEKQAALQQELDTVLAGRDPALEDLAHLSYTDAVMWEALRIYPPIWLMGRLTLEEDLLPSQTRIEKNSQILMVNWAAHRNPRHFADPEKFRPERFSEKLGIAQGYLPFSAGIRSCVGEPFAKMEIVLVLAILCQRFSFHLEPGQNVQPDLLILLRPKDPLRMRVKYRNPPPPAIA